MTPTAAAVVIMLLTCAQFVCARFLLLNTCVGLLYVPYILCLQQLCITTVTTVTMLSIYVESM